MEGMAWSFLRSFPLGTALDSIEHSHSSTALQVDLSKRSTAWHVQRRERKATVRRDVRARMKLARGIDASGKKTRHKAWHRRKPTHRLTCMGKRRSEAVETTYVEVRPAESSADCRAAAHLRALSFYEYPADRSEYAQRSHKQMKTDAEWESIEKKLTGKEVGYEKIQVMCLVATVPEEVLIHMKALEPSFLSYKIPGSEQGDARCVVGTLDINRGPRLPAEELAGILPRDNPQARGYLSNVCTLPVMRRKGIAKKLIGASLRRAQIAGIEILYVHVVEDNVPALKLYEEMGFRTEAREKTNDSKLLGRPSRLLLRLELPS
mmetsp:Transcript_1904/g.11623  ORF Transcript_1904/g.11623 Transcript_1904/m.11623 type:complete len:321 (+) Transcript_1904:3026-3988(+)